ncbi:hypothetical protein V8J36_20325 [Frigidibacter sp. MR17.14]|uniref:hypothetical protein n=1 Tax=Frigidibacter sp. MR17.14 TaxID=3126509 RepID=UPI003012E52F
MLTKVKLAALMDLLERQARGGDVAGALAQLDAAAAAGLAPDLGPMTALGQPRKLVAARLRLARAAGDAVGRAGLQALAVPPVALLAPLFAPGPAERAARRAAADQPVPRRLHQIWLGGPPPAACAAWAAMAARHGWEYRLWDAPALAAEGVDRDPVYAAMLAAGDLPGAVDVARYHLLARQGGVYLDCDWYPARADLPPEAALPMTGLSALAEPTPRLTHTGGLLLSNALIAAPPGHPALGALIAALPAVAACLPGAPAWWATGPLVFTLAARGGPVGLLAHGTVAAELPRATPPEEVEALAARLRAEDAPGLLIAWKGW